MSELYGYSTPLTTSVVKIECLFHRPVLILHPIFNPSARYKQSSQCLNHISQLGQNAQLLC